MADSDLPGKREAFIERLLESVRGTFDIFSAHIGARLGLYESLAEAGPSTSAELASQTGTHERYIREWLEQQAVTGILDVDDEKAAASARRFRLPEAHAEVLVDRESLNYLAPLPQLLVGAVSPISQVLDAYRKGGGVPYADYGADLVKGQEGINRTMFLQELGKVWLPAIADVHQRLGSDPSARVADVGCGAGWSAIGIAQSYPQVQVDGFDLDEASVEIARANAREAGLSDCVRFHVRDAADPQLAGRYDLVTAFECIHDMSRPVPADREFFLSILSFDTVAPPYRGMDVQRAITFVAFALALYGTPGPATISLAASGAAYFPWLFVAGPFRIRAHLSRK